VRRLRDAEPGEVRDCVLRLLDTGPRSPQHRDIKACFHWIGAELRQHGWTCRDITALVGNRNQDWHHRLNPNKLRGFLKYFEWMFKRENTPISCRQAAGAQYQGLCDCKPTNCKYHEKHRNFWNRAVEAGSIEFIERTGWPKYLTDYDPGLGLQAVMLMKALERVRARRNLPPGVPIFAGYRELAAEIWEGEHHHLSAMQACRLVRFLHDIEPRLLPFLPGRSGSRCRKATEFLYPLKFPPLPEDPAAGAAAPSGPTSPISPSGSYCVTEPEAQPPAPAPEAPILCNKLSPARRRRGGESGR